MPSCYDHVVRQMASQGLPKNKSFLKPMKGPQVKTMNKKQQEIEKRKEEERHQKKL